MPGWTYWYVVLFWPSLAIVAGLCVWKGDAPTKLAAAIFAAGMLVSKALTPSDMFSHLEVGIATVDATLAILLTGLCMRCPRLWLILLAAIQIAACLGHASRMLGMQHSRLTYAILTGSAGYPALIVLCCGLIGSIRSRTILKSRRV
ncbi:MAG: hypothetical protein E7773_00720 [Sphingomonas sp.]|nr:MAG: hypothetical protein E7773_00720 [Sphingomonas sp.]